MKKVFAGTFRGYDMYIEVPEDGESPDAVAKYWNSYTTGVREAAKVVSELRISEEMDNFLK